MSLTLDEGEFSQRLGAENGQRKGQSDQCDSE